MTTEYLVLTNESTVSGKGATWQTFTTVSAQSADAAIRIAAAQHGASTTYVAVPTRSWTPRAVTVETTPRVKLEEST